MASTADSHRMPDDRFVPCIPRGHCPCKHPDNSGPPTRFPTVFFLFRSNVVEAFSTKEVSISGAADTPGKAYRITKIRVGIIIPQVRLHTDNICAKRPQRQLGDLKELFPKRDPDNRDAP